MPELPDVETFRRYLDATALHQRIRKMSVNDAGVLGRTSPRSLQLQLKRREFETTRRHGENLFARVSGRPWLHLHFGMAGFLKCYRNSNAQPKHPRVVFHFADGYDPAYDNQRIWPGFTSSRSSVAASSACQC